MKYSVIIPVYKAEKTLNRCLDSLLKQKYEDAEIILINDGSPDGSGAICEEYAEKYPQIKYIAKENGGVSSARNVGLDAANGIYITFVDSDDYVTDDYFGTMDKALAEYDWDYMMFSNYKTDGENVSERVFAHFSAKSRERIIPALSNAICRKSINVPWAKLYKRELIEKHGIRFALGMEVGEDRAFNIKYSRHINSMAISDKPVYVVSLENENSLSRKKRTDLDVQMEKASKYLASALMESGLSVEEKNAYTKAFNFDTMRAVYTKAKYLHREKVPFFKRLKTIHKLCKDINKQKFTYPKTRFCRLISLPVRWNMALVIDAMAWKLTH